VDQLLGSRYLLHELVGRGAMGQVFRGSVRDSGAPVAVKVLKPELVSDPSIVARFVQERSILVSIAHPNVVRVLDLVVEGETLGIVMELIDGRDLRDDLRAQPTLPPAQAARFGCELLDGLAAVHAAGIVHRDVKPENLLLDVSAGQARLKLTDFGIARLTYGGSLTKLSSLIGTPEYMAPEVADHDTATAAADLYAVGIVLYEMLAGRTPFAGAHPLAVLRRHVDEEPPPIPGVQAGLWALIEALLAKEPDSRPGSAAQAAAALAALRPELADLPALAPMPEPAFLPATSRRATGPGVEAARARTVTVGALPARPGQAAPIAVGPVGQPVPAGADGSQRPRSRRRGKRAVVALSVAVLLVAAAATALAIRHESGAVAGPFPVVSYTFAAQQYPDGLLILRDWTLSGRGGSLLTETVTASSATGQPMQALFSEAIPSAIAATIQTVRFTPTPSTIVRADPEVQWQLNLPAQGFKTVGYRATVPLDGATSARLARWAAALGALQRQLGLTGSHAVELKSLTITPTSILMPQDTMKKLILRGQLASGSAAPAQFLAGAAWTSANTAVAVVGPTGKVIAVAPGSTSITAQVGTATASTVLVVSAPVPEVIPSSVAGGPSVGATSPISPTTPVSSSPPTGSAQTFYVFHTCVNGRLCDLNTRSGPGTSFAVTGRLHDGNKVQIVCQAAGQLETNSRGTATDVWDKLIQGDYVTDLYIDTPGSPVTAGTTGFTATIQRC
jgi:tRNA A-37 threonylcarbamoyl transferase component Bud32